MLNEVSNSNILQTIPQRIPVDGTFELTVRCNLHCKMCLFRHDDSENPKLLNEEMTAAEWIDMADQAAKAGTLSLLITGGEPMIRKDFCEIWEGIYRKGFLITLYTNATLVTPEIMETLRKYPPHKIGVTIYGASPETYQEVCGNGDAFTKAVHGMHELQKLPSIMEFRTTIIKQNYGDIDAIEDLVHREFGQDTRLIQTRVVTQAVRGACADVAACRLDPEDNVRLAYHRGIELIKQYVGDSFDERNLIAEYIKDPSENEKMKKLSLLGCDAGMNQYTISWDGKLLGCQMLGLFSTNARREGFDAAWRDWPSTIRLKPVNEKCKRCKNSLICNCCYASRYAETGDLGGLPEYVCRDTEIVSRLLEKGREKKWTQKKNM